MAASRQELAMQYLQLLQSGMPAAQAFKQTYPNGIPTAAQQQAIDAKKKQGSALAATGGTIAGLLGVKYLGKGIGSLTADATPAELAKKVLADQAAKQLGANAANAAASSGSFAGAGGDAATQAAWNAGSGAGDLGATQVAANTGGGIGFGGAGGGGAAAEEGSGLAFPSLTAQTAGPIAAALGATYCCGRQGWF
jgi:hypothetical protein